MSNDIKNYNKQLRIFAKLEDQVNPKTPVEKKMLLYRELYSELKYCGVFNKNTLELYTEDIEDLSYLSEAMSDWYIKHIKLSDTSKCINMSFAFKGIKLKFLEETPEMDTSNVIFMDGAFAGLFSALSVPSYNLSSCRSMKGTFIDIGQYHENKGIYTKIGYMDTSNVMDMECLFVGGVVSIDWEIDMSSCINCSAMLAVRKSEYPFKLKNVPKNLDLSNIGTDNYIIINYKEDNQDVV